MVKKLTLFLTVIVGGAIAFGGDATPENFGLHAEVQNPPSTEVIVWGEWDIDGVQGWSWGLCIDPPGAALIGECHTEGEAGSEGRFTGCAGISPDCTEVACTPEMERPGELVDPVPANPNPGFNTINVYDTGLTQGVVLDIMTQWNLPATSRFEMLRLNYVLQGDATKADLIFCKTLGTPAIDTVYVHEGLSIPPAVQESACIGQCECPFSLALNFGTPVVSGDECEQTAALPVLLTTGADEEVSGFQIGVLLSSTDAEIDIDNLDEMEGSDLQAAVAPDDVAYFAAQKVDGGRGVWIGCVPDLTEPFQALPACTADQEIVVLKIVPTVQQNVTVSASFENDLGDPPGDIAISSGDEDTLVPALGEDASISFTCEVGPDEPFIRGDTNQDGVINVSDAVAIAKAVFGLGSKLLLIQNCMNSADVNDDETVDTSDALHLLRYLFESGTPIPAPNVCGNDPTPGGLDCPQYPPCPR